MDYSLLGGLHVVRGRVILPSTPVEFLEKLTKEVETLLSWFLDNCIREFRDIDLRMDNWNNNKEVSKRVVDSSKYKSLLD